MNDRNYHFPTSLSARICSFVLFGVIFYSVGIIGVGCQMTSSSHNHDMARAAAIEHAIADIPGVKKAQIEVICLGARTFLIGECTSTMQANNILNTADRVAENHTVEGYLPLQSVSGDEQEARNRKRQIENQLVEHLGQEEGQRIKVIVISNQVILVGFGTYQQAKIATQVAKSNPGIGGVTNFIVLPSAAEG